MCLLCVAIHMRKDLPLIIMGNRDECYERPTLPSHFWEPDFQILAGKDLAQGGTWLGITRGGRFCTVLNYREPEVLKKRVPSRGKIVLEFLRGGQKTEDFLRDLEKRAFEYNGFNLIVGRVEELWWFSNRGGCQRLEKGIYALSNHLLNTPWPKVRKAIALMSAALEKEIPLLKSSLLEGLFDHTMAPDSQLPRTGVPLEWERTLSSVFVRSPNYGTRSSHLLLIQEDGGVHFVERTYEEGLFKQDREFFFYLNT
ncbi:MAG: NRDE family protein [Desulfatiglandales bacterium]